MDKKEIGTIKDLKWININAFTIKNGVDNIRYYRIPMRISNYVPPDNCHSYIKGETLSLTFKLDSAGFQKVEEQLKKDIREICIWLVEDEIVQLRDFLNTIDFSKKTH